MITGSFKHGKDIVPIQLGWKIAYDVLPQKGLDILTLMEEGNTVVPTIMLNDAVMIKIWFHYIKKAGDEGLIPEQTFEEALDILDQTANGLEGFRKAFWDMVVGFSPTPLQPGLRQMWKEAEKQLKERPNLSSVTSSSVSQQEQE